MLHDAPLLSTMITGLVLAFGLGLLASLARLPPIVGYLLAGVVVGPYTPGWVADQEVSTQLAELGVMLLMFGVGLHFSPRELLAVRAIAVPGAIGQILVATAMGAGLGRAMGWDWAAGLVFGLTLSVASTVVLLRALQERGLVESERGRIAVGWLIVEDLAMVLALVLLPPLAELMRAGSGPGGAELGLAIGGTVLRVAAFVALMLVLGRRLVPALLHAVAHTGSRELFRLAVLAVALGVALGSAALFDVSMALGAFFAGMVLAESPLSQQAAREILPLRDAFAVLFFVGVGMLLDWRVLLDAPLEVAATVLVVVVGKSLAAAGIVLAFRRPRATALTVAASLAQIGEFSFILIVLAVEQGLVPAVAKDLVVAGAFLSVLVNPLLFAALDRRVGRPETADGRPRGPSPAAEGPRGHVVLVGGGDEIGGRVATALRAAAVPLLVVEEESERAAALREAGIEAVVDESRPDFPEAARLGAARCLVLAIDDPFETGRLVERARAANPRLRILARAENEAGRRHLLALGAEAVVLPEEELARALVERVLADGRPR